jgi:beta-lactamase regulating signal transducer with metallopeptidase domain
METLQNIFQAEIIQRLGWTLVHFVWQAAAIGLILAIILKLLHKSSANLRYTTACMALVLIVLMPAVTIKMVDVSVETSEPMKEAAVDLPKVGADAQAVVEIPQVESPPAQVAVTPRVPLKDRFIKAVEPALPYVVVGWFVGVFGLSLWHLGGWRQLQRLRRQVIKQVTPTLKAKLQQLSNMLGIQETVGLVESALVQVPTVVGHLKPVILLPASALTGLSSEQIEAILAHELAHIKRHDYLVNMLQTVVEILGFYHPVVWWVSHKIRVERENCCDDMAVSLCSDRVCYARALTTMEEIRAGQLGLAVAASGGSLFNRIRRLLGKDYINEGKLSWLPSVIAILLIVALLIPVVFAMNNSQNQKNDTKIKSEIKNLSSSSDAEAERIIQKVLDKYRTMESYSAIGEVISDMDMSGAVDDMPELRSEIKDSKLFQDILKKSKKLKHEFRIKLARPGLYNIEWEQKIHPTFSNTGAVWSSNGKEHFLFNAGRKASPKDRTWALAMATGVSGGVANTIPSLFFDGQLAILRGLQAVNIRSEEQIDGDRCYVLSGQLAGMTMNFWISKKTLLIRQRQQILSGKFEMPEIPELSDEQIEEGLKITGQRITPEAVKEFKEAGKSAPVQMSRIKGTITETHRDIKVNQPTEPSEFIPDANEMDSYDEIELPQAALKNAQERAEELRQRSDALKKLRSLGLMLIMYANDNEEKYPNSLEDINPYDKDEILPWALENVRYLGQAKTITIDPQALIAYDRKMLLEKGDTNVLFNDSHVEFCNTKRLKDIGIDAGAERRLESGIKLKLIGTALLVYSADHQDEYPDTLEELRLYDIDQEVAWGLESVDYLGKGKKRTYPPETIIAYDRLLLNGMKDRGTNVLYNDGHLAFEKTETLAKLGIKSQRETDVQVQRDSWVVRAEKLSSPAEDKQKQITVQVNVFSIKSKANAVRDFLADKLKLEDISNDKPWLEPVTLTDTDVEDFSKWMNSQVDASILASPKVRTFQGEKSEMRVTNRAEYVAGYENGKPKKEEFVTGVEFTFTPELRKDKKLVVLKMDFKKRDLVELVKKIDESGNEVESPILNVKSINTTVAIKEGKSVLIPVSGLQRPETSGEMIHQTILLVRANVQFWVSREPERLQF